MQFGIILRGNLLLLTLPYLRLQMKALIARDLWNMDEYFAIFNESNDAVLRALQLLEKKK